MTKKERAEFDAALRAARVAGALRWTEGPARDVMPPTIGGEIANGWDFNVYNVYGARVEKACTGVVGHSFGNWDRTTTQRPRRIYSTKLLALRALRAELEKKYADELATLDEQIDAERKASHSRIAQEET